MIVSTTTVVCLSPSVLFIALSNRQNKLFPLTFITIHLPSRTESAFPESIQWARLFSIWREKIPKIFLLKLPALIFWANSRRQWFSVNGRSFYDILQVYLQRGWYLMANVLAPTLYLLFCEAAPANHIAGES